MTVQISGLPCQRERCRIDPAKIVFLRRGFSRELFWGLWWWIYSENSPNSSFLFLVKRLVEVIAGYLERPAGAIKHDVILLSDGHFLGANNLSHIIVANFGGIPDIRLVLPTVSMNRKDQWLRGRIGSRGTGHHHTETDWHPGIGGENWCFGFTNRRCAGRLWNVVGVRIL